MISREIQNALTLFPNLYVTERRLSNRQVFHLCCENCHTELYVTSEVTEVSELYFRAGGSLEEGQPKPSESCHRIVCKCDGCEYELPGRTIPYLEYYS